MEINAPGISNLSIPVDAQAKGEAGVGHYRRALNGYCVDSPADAERISATVLRELKVLTPLRSVQFLKGRASLRGQYGGGRIRLYGHARLATLLHELAHHVVRDRFPSAKNHGPEFKRVFVQVFQAFGVAFDVEVGRAAKAALVEIRSDVREIKVGDIVQQIGRPGKKFEVTGKARTRLILKLVGTDRTGYRANPVHLELA